MLWSTLPAVHLIFWAVYLWKLSKRWTGPNTTILQQSVHLPSNSAHFSVCVFIIWSQLSQYSSWQLMPPSSSSSTFYISLSSHQFVSEMSTYQTISSHNSNLNIWYIVWYTSKGGGWKQYFLIWVKMDSGSLHTSADVSWINSEILQNILVTFEAENGSTTFNFGKL